MTAPTKVYINNHIIYGQKSPLTPTTDDLLANCKNLISFVADNLTHNKPFEVPKFVLQQLFKKFEAQYTQNLQENDIIASLLKTEQTLSCLAGVSPLHEQQVLVSLIPQTCFQDQISHVLLLLSKSIDPGQARNYQKFKEVIEFLAPFMKYLSTIDSDFAKFLTMDLESAKALLKETIKTLLESIVVFESSLPILPNEENAEDLEALLITITQFRDQIIKQKSVLDTKFYYILGLCSFIAHLTNSVLKQDPIFLRILLLSSLFYNTLNEAINANNTTYVLDKMTLKPSSWLQVFSSTDHRLQQSLDCLLTPLQVLHQDFSKVLTEQNSDIQPVVLNLLQTLEKNKTMLIKRECSLYDYFPNQYDFLVHEILSLLSFFIKQAPVIESLKDYIQHNLLIAQELSSATIAKCYSLLETKEFNQNLHQILFETHDQISPMYLNYILKNVLLNIDQITNLEQIYQTYISKTEIETTGSSKSLIKVGVFLLNLLKNLPQNCLNETTKTSFIISFINLITQQQQQVEHWDIIQIQKDLWTHLDDLLKEPVPSMTKFLLLLEKASTGATPIQIETFPTTFSNTAPHTQKFIFNVLLTSLESIYANITTIWGQKGDSSTQKIQAINSEFTRLTLFTIPWLSYLTSILNLQAKFSLQKLYVLQTKLASIYYHPAFLLYLNSDSHTQLLEAIKKSMEPKPIPQYILNQAFYENLAEFLSQTLQELGDNFNLANEGITGLHLSGKDFSQFQAQFLEGKITSKPYIMLQAALFTLGEQQNIFTIHSKNPGCPLDEKYQSLLVSVIKKTRTSLFKFLTKIISLIALENGPADESESDLAKRITSNQDFMRALTPTLQGLVSVFSNVEKAQVIIEEGFTEFLIQALENNQGSSSYAYALKIIGGMLEKISTLISGKVLLNKTLLTSLIQTFAHSMERKQALETLPFQQKLIYRNSMDYIEGFLPQLYNSFTLSLSNKNQPWLDKFPNSSLDSLVETLLNEMMQGLDLFDPLKIQALSCQSLNNYFVRLLSLYEALSIHYLKSKPQEEKNPTADKILTQFTIFLNIYPFKLFFESDLSPAKEFKNNYLKDTFKSISAYTFALIQQENLCPGQDFEKISSDIPFDNSLPSVISTLLTKLNFLENLIKNLGQSFTFPHNFIVGIYHTSLFIMNKLISSPNALDLLADINNLLPLVSRILLSSLTSPEACTENLWNTLNLSLSQWVTQLWALQTAHHLSLNNTVLNLPLTFMHMGFHIQPQEIQPLLFDSTSIFYEMLSSNFLPKDKNTENIIFNVFDFFLQDSLPLTLSLELAIKRKILPNQTLPLTSIQKELSVVDPQTLSFILSDPFILVHNDNSTSEPRAITSSNISSAWIKINSLSEDPQLEIQRILKSLSSRSTKIMDILLSNLLDNHLYNLSEKTQSETEADFLQKRKETFYLFQTLTSLLYKYPHLILYLIYQEKDYRSLLQKYQATPENLEEYQSITFLDVLHKTRFGIYNPQSLLLLIKAFTFSYIGVAIKDPANKLPFRDISMIVGKHLFDFLSKILKHLPQENSTKVWQLETSLTYYMVLAGFLALYESLNKRYNQEEVNMYFKEQIDELLNGILKALIFFKDHPSYLAGPIINCLNMVNARILGIRYYQEVTNQGISDPQLDKFKLYHFQECLNVQPELLTLQLPTLENNINDEGVINKKEFYGSSSSLSLANDFPDKFDTRNDVYPTTKWPYFVNETAALVQIISEKNPNPPAEQATLLFYLKNTNYDLGKTTASTTSVLRSLSDNLRFVLHEKYILKSEKKEENFNNLIGELHLQAISQKSLSEATTKEASPVVPVSYPEEMKHSEVYQPRSALWLDHFLNTEIITEEDFKNKQREIRGELKRIHEKVYSSRISFDHKTHDQETEQMIINEILEKITKSTKFETSLIYTCIEEFNTLKNFPYPPEYPDIQKEYARIQEDFSIYLVKLIECRDNGIIDDIMIDDRQQTLIGFKFCTDEENKISAQTEAPQKEPNPTFDHAQEKYLQGCQRMCHFNDEAIKGLISMLHIHPIPQHNFYELLESACKSPKVAVQILDYILTFLYCYIPCLENEGSFPFKTVTGETCANKTFEIVAKNMLKFLEKFMKQNISLLFQPRSILEEYGLKQSLEKIKLDQNYLAKTKDSITCMDLLIGTLNDKQIKGKENFIKELDAIIKSEKDLKIIDDEASEKPLQKGEKAITLESCKIFTKDKTPKELMHKDFVRFTVYNYKRFIQEMAETIPTLTTKLEQVIPNVKSALANQDSNTVQQEIDTFNYDCSEPEKLDSLSGFFSSSLSVWILSKDKASNLKTQIPDEINRKMLKTLSEQILQEKLFEDFMIHLLELSSALLDESLKDISAIPSVLEYFLKICLHFYALLIVQKISQRPSPKVEEEDSKEMALPVLSSVISTESAHDLESLPKVAYTFSEVKRSRQFDMEILLTDIFRKYSSQISRIIYKDENDEQGNQVFLDELFIICKTLPFILSFKDKKENLMNEFTDEKYKLQIQDEYRRNLSLESSLTDLLEIKIDRENMLETSIAGFTNKPQKEIKQTLEVQYFEEEGFDGGGLSREWFTLVSKEIFDPKFGLFRYSTNKMSIQPSPSSRLIPSHLKYMEFAGMLVAKAIRDEAIIDVTFTKSFLKHILRRNIAFNDLEDVDLELSKNLKWMLENSVEGLEQCFTYETELLGQYHTIELVPDGYDFVVTDSNKKDYMRKLCENKMKNEIALELGAFMKGFDLLISPHQLALFSPSELQLLISGCPTVNVADIKKHAMYNGGFNDQSPQIIWLWEILESFSQKELGAFVYFVSGSPKVRCESLETNPFCFRKVTIDVVSLPVAHTCYLELEIPVYTTQEELRQKLLLAIFEGQESFQLY